MRRSRSLCLLFALSLNLLAMTGYCWQEEYEFVLEWGSAGSDTGQFNRPYGMCVDKYDCVYVCDLFNQRVQKFDSLGNFIMMFGSPGSSNGEFNAPLDVTVDDTGYIYVTDAFTDRVQKFDSLGNFLLVWGFSGSGPGQFLGVRGVSVDSAGYLYATDYGNHRVQKGPKIRQLRQLCRGMVWPRFYPVGSIFYHRKPHTRVRQYFYPPAQHTSIRHFGEFHLRVERFRIRT